MIDDLDDETKDGIHGMLYNHLMSSLGKSSVMDKFGPKDVPEHGIAIEHTKVEPIGDTDITQDLEEPDAMLGHEMSDEPEDEDLPNLVQKLRNLRKK